MGNMEHATVGKDVLERIDAAAIDGRAHNVRYRQGQLHLLAAFIQKHADKICEAIARDSGLSQDETVFELYQSIETIRTLYGELDVQAALDEEYSIAKNKDNISARVPIGIVVIRPGQYSRLFSVISPAAAALAAGNCVVVEIPNSLRHLDMILRSELTTLDPDAFIIVAETVKVSCLSSNYLIVDQIPSGPTVESSLVSNMQALSVAIVDRTADVEQAATAICAARFCFQGGSPYAPDVVLVNEWVREDFVSACLKLASIAAAAVQTGEKPGAASNGQVSGRHEEMTVLFDSKRVRLLEGTRRIIVGKTTGRTLVVVSMTSLVDVISFTADQIHDSIAVSYCFGDLKSAKFLGQHIDSSTTYVNGIPPGLLVGPVRPVTATVPLNMDLRYETNMMSRPSPQVIAKKKSGVGIARLLRLQSRKDGEFQRIVEDVRKQALIPFKPTGQSPGTSLGFFDQGIMTGLVAFVLPSLVLIGYGSFQASIFMWRHFMLSR